MFSQKFCTSRVNALRLDQNGSRFAGDSFKYVFPNGSCCIMIEMILKKFVPNESIDNKTALVQVIPTELKAQSYEISRFPLCGILYEIVCVNTFKNIY